ncbi:MAG: hypothetical protein WC781_04015 [Candidatus Pacearchaeota archaeon]|jgi:hypothetical protein
MAPLDFSYHDNKLADRLANPYLTYLRTKGDINLYMALKKLEDPSNSSREYEVK